MILLKKYYFIISILFMYTSLIFCDMYYKERDKILLLIINYGWSKFYYTSNFINNTYIPFFRNFFKYNIDIVFYGPKKSRLYNIKSNGLKDNGYYSYKNLILAYESYYYYDGYIYINDDGFLNPILFNSIDFKKILIESLAYNNVSQSKKWFWINKTNERNISYYSAYCDAIKTICKYWRYKFSNFCVHYSSSIIVIGWTDFFYIPRRYVKEVVDLMKIFYENLVFLEYTITTIVQFLTFDIMGKKCQKRNESFFSCIYIHPIKYSKEKNKEMIKYVINSYKKIL